MLGHHNILLELRPASIASRSDGNSRQGNGSVSQGVDLSARAEYEQAMAAYKKALELRNVVRLGQNSLGLSKTSPNADQKSKAFSDLVDLGQQSGVRLRGFDARGLFD